MRVPSRHMPARTEETLGWFGTLGIAAFLLGLCALVGWQPVSIFLSVVIVMSLIGWICDARIANARSNESICDFARTFDCRIIDTWIIRATFEELSHSYPVRPDDNLANDLGIVDQDLDYSLEAIAERAGRSIDETGPNSMYYKVVTVRDLVMFLQNQPKAAGH